MNILKKIECHKKLWLVLYLIISFCVSFGQERDSLSSSESEQIVSTAAAQTDSLIFSSADRASTVTDTVALITSHTILKKTVKEKKVYWSPNPQKALWFSLLVPGMGQIYNRSYWKVPLIYGLGAGCVYVVSFQGRMYRDYSSAYYALTDNDPATKDYEPIFEGLGENDDAWKMKVLDRKITKYRRLRDLAIFGIVLLYVANALDAFVDAHLYDFDISEDLSMKLLPSVNEFNIEGQSGVMAGKSFGMKLSFRF